MKERYNRKKPEFFVLPHRQRSVLTTHSASFSPNGYSAFERILFAMQNNSLCVRNNKKVKGQIIFHYWSSSSNVNNTNNAWIVNFNNGNVNNNNKTNNNYVRCVRGV
jgi:hypothetical protein